MRPRASWITVATDLATAVAERAPAWVSTEARDATRAAAALLRRDALAVVDGGTREAAAVALGVVPRVLYRWLGTGGWLHRKAASPRARGPRAAED